MRLKQLHNNHIRNTEKEAIVSIAEVSLCNLTNEVRDALGYTPEGKTSVFVNTKILKHLYYKRTAQEYDKLLVNAHTFVKYPDKIFKNKDSKKGDLVFYKKMGEENWICSINICLCGVGRTANLHRNTFDTGINT